MKLDKEIYTKEEVKNCLAKILNYCETEINRANKQTGEMGWISINCVRKEINTIKEEVKSY